MMMKIELAFAANVLVLSALVSCAAPTIDETVVPLTPTVSPTRQPSTVDLSRTDEQGAVVVTVSPQNLDDPADALNFLVAMNTHSVDLDMDLIQLATLETDTGIRVTPMMWDGASGGHHVSGTLSFPAILDGKSILEGATRLTVMIREVDVPERIFTWELTP